VRLALPEARLVVDRFHVMKALNEDLKRLKNKEKKALPKAAQACHYALLKNEEALTEQQQTTLAAVYAASPRLKQAHQLKEAFRAIFEERCTISKAHGQLRAWIKRAYKANLFPTVLTSLKHWLRPILNYFAQRTTNAASEGVNNKVKLIKRRAYGFRNFGNFRLRILAAF
jgi:transposase